MNVAGPSSRFTAALALGLALTLSGCKSNPPAPAPVQNGQVPAQQQQVPLSNGQYASAPAGQPNGTATPNTAAPGTAAPSNQQVTAANQPAAAGMPAASSTPVAAPLPPPPPPTAPAGTAVTFRINEGISSTRNQIGDRFTGNLTRGIVSHGKTVFPAGTSVAGSVVALNRKGRFKGAGDLGIVLVEVGGHRVETTEYEKVVKGVGRRTTGLVAGGAGLGALIGGLAGHGKGALIGGLAGAGAGTGASAVGNRSVSLPAESVITVRLSTSLTR